MHPSTEPTKTLLTVEAAAQSLSISRSQCYALMRRGDLASVKIGSSRRISIAALDAFVTGLEPAA